MCGVMSSSRSNYWLEDEYVILLGHDCVELLLGVEQLGRVLGDWLEKRLVLVVRCEMRVVLPRPFGYYDMYI